MILVPNHLLVINILGGTRDARGRGSSPLSQDTALHLITKNYKNHDQAPQRMRTKQSSWNHAIYRAKSQIKCYRKLLMCILWSHSFGFIHLLYVFYGRTSGEFMLRTSVLIPSYDMTVQ